MAKEVVKDKLCGLQYQVCVYDMGRNLYKECKDVSEAKITLSRWKGEGSKKSDIIIVNANPTPILKEVFPSMGSATPVLEISVERTKKSRSYYPITLVIKGVEETFYLEMRMSVLRDISDIEKAISDYVSGKYHIVVDKVLLPLEVIARIDKAKGK